MASPEHHRSTAESLLDKAQEYGPSAAARLAYLTEAVAHATLALSAPATLVVPEGIEPADFKPSPAPIFAAEDTTDDTPPAPKRRTRKAAPAKTEEAAK